AEADLRTGAEHRQTVSPVGDPLRVRNEIALARGESVAGTAQPAPEAAHRDLEIDSMLGIGMGRLRARHDVAVREGAREERHQLGRAFDDAIAGPGNEIGKHGGEQDLDSDALLLPDEDGLAGRILALPARKREAPVAILERRLVEAPLVLVPAA